MLVVPAAPSMLMGVMWGWAANPHRKFVDLIILCVLELIIMFVKVHQPDGTRLPPAIPQDATILGQHGLPLGHMGPVRQTADQTRAPVPVPAAHKIIVQQRARVQLVPVAVPIRIAPVPVSNVKPVQHNVDKLKAVGGHVRVRMWAYTVRVLEEFKQTHAEIPDPVVSKLKLVF